tara:strand:+ start:5104 stop:5616 length:513 start_codon:yes stop_codon:yes gene_type:complete
MENSIDLENDKTHSVKKGVEEKKIEEVNMDIDEHKQMEEEEIIIIDNDSRECYNAIKNYLVENNQAINTSNIVQLLIIGMESVESITYMSGLERKNLVTHVIKKIIKEESNIDRSKKELLIDMLEEIIPNTIDIIINTSRGKYSLNRKPTKKCCLGILGVCVKHIKSSHK